MPYSLLPFILIVAGLIAAGFVLLKRFPQIALLDVDKLPEEVQARRKKAILEEKYSRALKDWASGVGSAIKPLGVFWKWFQKVYREYVTKTYIQYAKHRARSPKKTSEAPPPEAIAALLKDAETSFLTEKFEEAEQNYIEVIRLSPRTVEAYRGLGRLYLARRQFGQAKETYEFIVKMDPKDARAFNRLGIVSMEEEKWKDAVGYFKRAIEIDNKIAIRHFDLGLAYEKLGKDLYALRSYERSVSLEPLNPKYLDAYLESSILLENKELAEVVFEQLKIANPENQKLDDFKRRIEDLE